MDTFLGLVMYDIYQETEDCLISDEYQAASSIID